MLFQFLVLLSIIAVISAQQWHILPETATTTIVGVGARSATEAVSAAAENGVGGFIGHYDGKTWNKDYIPAGLVLDAAINKNGVRAATTAGSIFVSNEDGTYTKAANLHGLSQNINVFANGESFAAVGSYLTGPGKSIDGVAYSSDGGRTWALSSSIPTPSPRYGAFPSANVWYVSSGTWPASSLQGVANSTQLSANLFVSENTLNFRSSAPKLETTSGATGWFGAVSKSTDGGKSWSQVFSSDLENDSYYFNEISCGSESNCIVVGEGNDAAGAGLVLAFATFDGGVTWEKTFSAKKYSSTAVKFVSENEAWITAADKTGFNVFGEFYRTVDGGKTFELIQSLKNCYPLDIDFAENVGYAACISSSGSSCAIGMYN